MLPLQITQVADWELEDKKDSTLSTELVEADPKEALELLEKLRLELPDSLDHRSLGALMPNEATPLGASLAPDYLRYDYHLIEIPLTILVPYDGALERRLVRLRLTVAIDSPAADPPVALCLFPRDTSTTTEHDHGEVGVDVSKLLALAGVPAVDVLTLNLKAPLKWTSKHVKIQTTDKMSNPVDWYVRDRAINEGLTTYMIARVGKDATVKLRVGVVGEMRRPGLLGKVTKARFRAAEQLYTLT